jgi:hypothetical protein
MSNSDAVTVSLQHLLTSTKPVYPQDANWNDTLTYMKNDAVDWEIALELTEVLEHEDFREPIAVQIVDGEPGPYFVTDGTHRMIAHMLYDSENVRVVYTVVEPDDDDEDDSDDATGTDAELLVGDDDDYEDDDYQILVTKVVFANPIDRDDHDLDDDIFMSIRSFKLSNAIWMNADTVNVTRKIEYKFIWSLDEADDALIKTINDICVERISRLVPVPFETIKTYFEGWDSDD